MPRAGLRLHRVVMGFALSGLLAACGSPPPFPVSPPTLPPSPTPAPSPRVVIVSIDGLRPDAVQQMNGTNLSGLATSGAYTWKAQTVMPSNTLPSHTSMLTGYTPARHGITWDDYAPDRGRITLPTIFLAARRAGLGTAMVVGKEKFNTLRDTGDMDVFVGGARTDDDVANQAIVRLQTNAALLFVHLPDVDLSGHATFWMSTSYTDRIMSADRALGRIVSALPANTTVIVTADHGGHDNLHGTNNTLDLSIPWIIAGPRTRKSYALTGAVATVDTAATAAYILGLTLPSDITGKPVLEAFATN